MTPEFQYTFAFDVREAQASFIEKRPPVFTGE